MAGETGFRSADTERNEFQREPRSMRRKPEDVERPYWVPGCLLGTFSCDLPRGPCADIISILQTGALPAPCLHPL